MKYIVIELTSPDGSQMEIPVIFPNVLVHKTVANQIMEALRRDMGPGAIFKPVAAGEMSSMDIRTTCHGESESLKLANRGSTDDELIRMHDYMHGIL